MKRSRWESESTFGPGKVIVWNNFALPYIGFRNNEYKYVAGHRKGYGAERGSQNMKWLRSEGLEHDGIGKSQRLWCGEDTKMDVGPTTSYRL